MEMLKIQDRIAKWKQGFRVIVQFYSYIFPSTSLHTLGPHHPERKCQVLKKMESKRKNSRHKVALNLF